MWWIIGDVGGQLSRIESLLNQLVTKGDKEMASLDTLIAQVAQNTSVEQSAITLIQGLAAQLAAAATDPQKVADLAAQLKSSSDALSAAIVANTPAAPTA